MLNTQTQRIRARLGLICILVAGFWFLSSNADSEIALSQNITQFDEHVPVTTVQLEADNGVIPINLKCENAEMSTPNTIKRLACVLQNNTNKYISAVSINIGITLDDEGISSVDSTYLTIETVVHPDFRDEHKTNFIPPGGKRHVEDLQTSYDNAVVKGVTLRIDYVEFADNSAPLGRNRAGSRTIADIRAGAAKYKDWLSQKYLQSGNSISSVQTLIEERGNLPAELNIRNGDEQQGVFLYRNYARRTFETKGPAGLIKYLKRTSTSSNR